MIWKFCYFIRNSCKKLFRNWSILRTHLDKSWACSSNTEKAPGFWDGWVQQNQRGMLAPEKVEFTQLWLSHHHDPVPYWKSRSRWRTQKNREVCLGWEWKPAISDLFGLFSVQVIVMLRDGAFNWISVWKDFGRQALGLVLWETIHSSSKSGVTMGFVKFISLFYPAGPLSCSEECCGKPQWSLICFSFPDLHPEKNWNEWKK